LVKKGKKRGVKKGMDRNLTLLGEGKKEKAGFIEEKDPPSFRSQGKGRKKGETGNGKAYTVTGKRKKKAMRGKGKKKRR